MSYIGNSPGVASQRIPTSFTATSGQTLFTLSSGYSLGYLDVFLNGAKLVNGQDYTATNGSTITLTQAASAGDSVECIAYLPRGLSDGYLKSEADAEFLRKANEDGVLIASGTPANTLVTTNGGNVGIGVAPSAWNSAYRVLDFSWASLSSENANQGGMRLNVNAYADSSGYNNWYRKNNANATSYKQNDGIHSWYTAPYGAAGSAITFTQAMTLDSSGNLLVGTTDTSMAGLKGIRVGSGAATGAGLVIAGSGATNKGFFYSSSAGVTWETASGVIAQVLSGGGGGVSLANGATSWSAISDERHKDIIEPISNAANKVASLRAVIGKYKTDETETRRAFLIAQDVQAVLPEAVDSTDAESLALRYSDVTPLLVAAIQEQQAIITALTARVEALEGVQQ